MWTAKSGVDQMVLVTAEAEVILDGTTRGIENCRMGGRMTQTAPFRDNLILQNLSMLAGQLSRHENRLATWDRHAKQ